MSAIGLPNFSRIQVLNECTQNLAANAVKVKFRRAKFDSVGALSFEAEDTVYNFGSILADNVYAEGTDQDNGTDKYLAADVLVEVVFPLSSADQVLVFLQISTDGGTTWPADGEGILLVSVPSPGGVATVRRNLEM